MTDIVENYLRRKYRVCESVRHGKSILPENPEDVEGIKRLLEYRGYANASMYTKDAFDKIDKLRQLGRKGYCFGLMNRQSTKWILVYDGDHSVYFIRLVKDPGRLPDDCRNMCEKYVYKRREYDMRDNYNTEPLTFKDAMNELYNA